MPPDGGTETTATPGVGVRIVARPGDDEADVDTAASQLRTALLDLEVRDVVPVTGEAPAGAKGLAAALGWLWVTLGGEALRTVVDKVADWAARGGRTVEVTVNGNTLKLTRVSPEEQRELIDAWLAALPPGTLSPGTNPPRRTPLAAGHSSGLASRRERTTGKSIGET